MIDQYYLIKRQLPADTVLALRLGDFLEFFGEDAKLAARIISLTLTKRRGHPMAGFPHWSADSYLAKLTAAGHPVAIAQIDNKTGQVAIK